MSYQATNPGPLGLFGFALTTFLLSFINAGWLDPSSGGMVIASAFAFGGFAQLLAGLFSYPKGNTFGFCAFASYGAFWITYGLFVAFFSTGVSAHMVGAWLLLWGILSFVFYLSVLKGNRTIRILFIVLIITFFVLAIGHFVDNGKGLIVFGGYLGILTALLAFYLGAAEIINESNGRNILPI